VNNSSKSQEEEEERNVLRDTKISLRDGSQDVGARTKYKNTKFWINLRPTF